MRSMLGKKETPCGHPGWCYPRAGSVAEQAAGQPGSTHTGHLQLASYFTSRVFFSSVSWVQQETVQSMLIFEW